MVYRKFRKFRKTYRKKSVHRPFKKYTGVRVKNGRTIHYFKRTRVDSWLINEDFKPIPSYYNVTPSYNTFKLDHVPNYSDFTNLYDSYKICGIRRKYIFDRNTNIATDVDTVRELPRLITVNDFNDQNALTSENEALQYASCKIRRLDRPISRYFRPTQLDYNGATTRKSTWNSTATPNQVAFYGIKEASVQQTDNVTTGTLHIYTTYYVACRTPR